MVSLTQQNFDALWPVKAAGVQPIVQGILAQQATVFPKYGITSFLILAHMMAQFSAETGGATEMVESLNYSAQGLLNTWPHRFTPAQAQQYGRTAAHAANQTAIGDLAYNGRMGNAPGTNDGYTFRGRGLIQTTGRDGYTVLGKRVGLPLDTTPDLIVDPAHALECAVNEFVSYSGNGKSMIDYCNDDNLVAVSSLINLGHITQNPAAIEGYDSRLHWLEKWKQQFGI